MKEIGGFFGLELNRGKECHSKAIRLNSGRKALWYFIKVAKPKRIYLPYYICDSVISHIQRENVSIGFYHINNYFEPLIDGVISSNNFMLYVNYFGINEKNIHKLAANHKYLIIDNSQAFFSKPIENLCTFYSPRKFFGVPDGGYLYIDEILEESLENDISYNKCEHLLKRLDVGASTSYEIYKNNEELLEDAPIKRMSKLTQSLLASIDYAQAKSARERNFLSFHKVFSSLNELELSVENLNGPMVYPLLISKDGLKEYLIKNGIYVATYWKEVLERVKKSSLEYKFTEFLIPLPIDQRYGSSDVNKIIDMVINFV
ncbi:ATP-utilizing enzymes of ATP-grasp superfamily [Candidatus Scalindua japonica]|uniref:ATP-utilizing enzymes of ATP-grasp superfamily n=1 Tax=Candidatus Scalindua japonica TaxID=1284222 RepID=A0A286U4H9_9BACT|nr:hypothetical protein [Candidatus Scalindua japonica]GAX62971.1 ATP-utilizing enzymes of ATP-grasp superfamily [Candidatus Scalindua japonica]